MISSIKKTAPWQTTEGAKEESVSKNSLVSSASDSSTFKTNISVYANDITVNILKDINILKGSPINTTCTLAELAKGIRTGGNAKSIIEKLRTFDISTSEGQSQYNDFKKTLPAYNCAVFKDSKCLKETFISTCTAPMDADHLTEKQIADSVALLEQDPHTILIHVSPGGKGLKWLVIIPETYSNEEYRHIYEQLQAYYSKLLKLKIDGNKDSRRLTFVSLDPNCILKDFAIPFTNFTIPEEVNDLLTVKEASDYSSEIRKLNIVDICDKYGIQLKQKGNSLVGMLPGVESRSKQHFHVNPVKNTWYDFHTQEGGGGLHLIALLEKLITGNRMRGALRGETFFKALKAAGIQVPEKKESSYQHRSEPKQEKQSAPKQEQPKEDPWPEPEDILNQQKLAPVLPYSDDMLPPVFARAVADISERMQAPPDFIATNYVISASSVISYKINIRPKKHDTGWTVSPNLWGASIGAPSVMKTPTQAEALVPLKALDQSAAAIYENQRQEYCFDIQTIKAMEDCTKSKVTTLMKSGKVDGQNYQSEDSRRIEAKKLFQKLDEQKNSIEEPKRRRYIVQDCSIEKLQEIQSENAGHCVLVKRDELTGFFRKLDSSGHEADRAYYIEGWTGDSDFSNDTITRGSTQVKNNTLALTGTIQPSMMRLIQTSAGSLR